ncbi:MAG: molybdopterin-guanine dinucleotide biosynthesis adapter protein [Planctomycetota bacterium]|nr:molybdopterin-guanine dinucleotide biosynthesis adapter protein [Planctomycetota bacterium]
MLKYIPVVSIIGKQNTGKTTLISLIIPLLKKKGYKIGTIKYNIPSFEIDYKGKDTYRHYEAGADVVSISSSKKLAIVKRVDKKSPSIKAIIEGNYRDIDIVLVEGYKHWRYPYIEIQNNHQQKKSENKEDKHHLRITSMTNTHPHVPTFTKSDLKNVVHFIESIMK